MRKRLAKKRRTGRSVWLAAIAIIAALFLIGDDNPQLRRTLETMLQDVISGEPAPEHHVGNSHVVDGDTLDLGGTRIRLFGIDAPETSQTCKRDGRVWGCGAEAEAALVSVISGRDVSCEEQDTDRYGRIVGICRAGTENLNAWMVANGWAVAYRQYGGDLYDLDEALARLMQRGIWDSDFVMPWDWRRGQC